MEELDIRPMTVLNRYLVHSGLDRHRHDTGAFQLVAMYDAWNELADDFRTVFVPLAINDDMEGALHDGYLESVRLIKDDFERGLTDNSRKLGALIFVMYGDAQLAQTRETVSPDTPSRYLEAASWGMVRSRLVHVVSPDGFATESVLFPPEGSSDDADPLVDVSEFWADAPSEEEQTTGQVGALPHVTPLLSMVLGIALLLGMAAERGVEPSISALGRMASEFASGEEEGNMADEVLGLLTLFGDTVREEGSRLTRLGEELREMLGGDD